MTRKMAMLLVLAAGCALAWVDTRPGWDDTGIMAVAVVLVAALGALAGVRPWLAAVLTIGPLLALEWRSGSGVQLAVPIALVGAYAGALVRRAKGGT